jgi:hypothetical protein
MRKNYLNESIEEDVETTPQTQKVGFDEFNRFCLQLTEEEQDTLSFKEIMAKLLDCKHESIKSMKRAGLGWEVHVVGDAMSELDDIMDDNADVLKRLKDSDDDTYTPDTLDDNFMVDDEDDDMEDWEREGYNSEIAYRNRWRDYRDDEDDDEGDDEEEDRDPYSPWNRDY